MADSEATRGDDPEFMAQRLALYNKAASHDLQSPLRTIRNLVDFAVEDHGDEMSDELRSRLGEIDRRAAALKRLVLELLDYSQRAFTAEPVSTDVAALVDDALIDVDRRGHHIEAVSTVSGPVVVDAVALAECIRQLVDNACRHHDDDAGRITITSSLIEGELDVSVRDDGPGLLELQHERIFEPFVCTDKQDSSGLGLTEVRRIVERAGGSVTVESKLGEGSVFSVRWPLPQSTP